MSRRGMVTAFLLCLCMAWACAPIGASSAISRAGDELRKAQQAGAGEFTVGHRYESKAQQRYFMATRFHAKAKELQGFSEFERASYYADRAAVLAREAVNLLKELKARQDTRCAVAVAPVAAPAPVVQQVQILPQVQVVPQVEVVPQAPAAPAVPAKKK